MNILLMTDYFAGWGGGVDLLSTLHAALLEASEESNVQLACIADWREPMRRIKRGGEAALKCLRTACCDGNRVRDAVAFEGKRARISRLFGGAAVVVLPPSGRLISQFYGKGGKLVIGPLHAPLALGASPPWLGYIPDCQHRHLPDFFSSDERLSRDMHFKKILGEASVVIVNSKHTVADLQHYYGSSSADIVALPFSASPNPQWRNIDGAAVCARYGVSWPFFLCSNQFWRHKNHHVIVDALSLPEAGDKPWRIVFTGEMSDYRGSDHIDRLLADVKRRSLDHKCIFLGHIPKFDQIGLMKQALAVIQPTLFEGGPGGGAVYDAIALGRRTIVSNIAINHEINEHVTQYFDPHSPRELLVAMEEIFALPHHSVAWETLEEAGRHRLRNCGTVLLAAFERVLSLTNA